MSISMTECFDSVGDKSTYVHIKCAIMTWSIKQYTALMQLKLNLADSMNMHYSMGERYKMHWFSGLNQTTTWIWLRFVLPPDGDRRLFYIIL